jgi:subtilisin family serine protease
MSFLQTCLSISMIFILVIEFGQCILKNLVPTNPTDGAPRNIEKLLLVFDGSCAETEQVVQEKINALIVQYPCLIQRGPKIHKLQEDYFVYLEMVTTRSTINTRTCLDESLIDYNTYCIEQLDYELLVPMLSKEAPPEPPQLCVQRDVSDPYRWHLDYIDGVKDNLYTHTDTSGFQTVDIYILDSGIRETHYEFSQVSYELMDTSFPNPINTHGTHVAGIVVGLTCGITSHPLYDYPVCRRLDGLCNHEDIENGFDAVLARLQSTGRRGVISMAFGTTVTNPFIIDWYNDRLQQLVDAGGVNVAAGAGCDFYPGASDHTISVASFDNYYDDVSPFYGYMPECADILAPGGFIRSAYYLTDNSYLVQHGPSTSTAIVTGLASILLSLDDSLTQTSILQKLNSNTVRNAVIFGCQEVLY